MKFIVAFLLLCSPAWAQHNSTNGYFLNTTNVSKSSVSALPGCGGNMNGTIRQVTDALAPTVGTTVAGAGAVIVLVHCNGSNWIVG